MAASAPAMAKPKAGPARPKSKPVVQTKLAVGSANDRFEQEADRIAQRVGTSAAVPAAPPMISGLGAQRQAVAPPPGSGPERKKGDVPKPPEKRAQRRAVMGDRAAASPKRTPSPKSGKPAKSAQRDAVPANAGQVGTEGGTAPDHVEQHIDRMRTRAAPGLDPATRQRVEAAVGSDLGDVRVHRDAGAAEAASALGARAFTVGRDMFFGQGQFNPATMGGQKLIAHEAAHTVQQRGGSAHARRIQRAGGKSAKPDKKKPTALDPNKPITKTRELKGTGWSLNAEPTKEAPNGGTIHVPKLELPTVVGKLKGSENPAIGPASGSGILPVEGAAFTRNPQEPRADREDGAAFEKWVDYMRTTASKGLQTALETQVKAQKDAAEISKAGSEKDVYVLKRKNLGSDSLDVLLVGTVEELSRHDGLLRPMISKAGKGGAAAEYDADHILEDQLGGLDSATNMWLLDRSYNRSVGAQIKNKINDAITTTLDKAETEADVQRGANVDFDGKIPDDVQVIKRNWSIVFDTVSEGKFGDAPKNYWSRDDITKGAHLKHFSALSEKELARQGFIFDPNEKPKRINVFPSKEGGRASAFTVSSDGKSLKKPGYFFRGITIDGAPVYNADALKENDTILIELPVTYTKKKGGEGKDKDDLVSASGKVTVKHDKRLGFGGYVSRDSVTNVFKNAVFKPLSPMVFPDVGINFDGDLAAGGQINASKALFPGLQVPVYLLGSDIIMSYPVPTNNLSLGPVSITDAAISLGVGDGGFFISGSAGIMVKDIGKGSISARVEKNDVILAGDFNLDMDFLDPAKIAMVYSLAKDDFVAKATLGVKKTGLPGVESGSVEVTITRQSVGVVGTLALGGVLAGASITIGYTPETGLVLEGKDIPLPVSKLPGVSDAALTVRAVRDPDSGAWKITGGGKAKLAAGGATGSLDILYDGVATSFTGRVDVAKGPATGWIQISGTNRAIDDKGNPVKNGPVGELKIWGKGEASITFGSVLKGTAGIEYTPDGHVIVSGEIALPPTYDLFPKKDLSPKEPLFSVAPPDFPIWGVKLGPVGIGIFAFVDASIRAEAFVGPGQLRDAKIKATVDLDKPEEAVVDGTAQFVVPSYAGLTLDVGGGVKAQVAVAYVKGRVGLYGQLGLGLDASFGVDVHWNQADGLAVGAEAKIAARPKFEVGVNASITAGVSLPWPLPDIDHTWGPWKKPLGQFGPDMELSATFPMAWSEKEGLDIDPDKIAIHKPNLDAKEIMKGAFDMLV
jgi:Domain of unknown function (DUF4157)